jgi:hypothetical protein
MFERVRRARVAQRVQQRPHRVDHVPGERPVFHPATHKRVQEWMRQILRQQNLHLHLTGADLLSANISSQCQWALNKVTLLPVSKAATTHLVFPPSRQAMLVYVWAVLTLAYTFL